MIDEKQEMLPYVTIMRLVEARKVTEQSEMVECYNGMRVAVKDSWIVTTAHGQTMVMSSEKFKRKFTRREIRPQLGAHD